MTVIVVSSSLLSNCASRKIPASVTKLILIIAHFCFSVFFLVVVLDDGEDAVEGDSGGFVERDF